MHAKSLSSLSSTSLSAMNGNFVSMASDFFVFYLLMGCEGLVYANFVDGFLHLFAHFVAVKW